MNVGDKYKTRGGHDAEVLDATDYGFIVRVNDNDGPRDEFYYDDGFYLREPGHCLDLIIGEVDE